MGSLRISHFPQMRFLKYPHRNLKQSSIITCGLRGGTKKPLWKSRVLSTEAIQAVHSLKLANSNSKLHHVISTRLSRLLKADLLDTLAELQRQNEFHLALKVPSFTYYNCFLDCLDDLEGTLSSYMYFDSVSCLVLYFLSSFWFSVQEWVFS